MSGEPILTEIQIEEPKIIKPSEAPLSAKRKWLKNPRIRKATDASVVDEDRGTVRYTTAHEAAFNAAVSVDTDAQIDIGVLSQLVDKDPLTNALNRRGYMEHLEAELDRMQRDGHDLTFIMLDVNYFKELNDIKGHAYGDKVLKKIARTLRNNVRATDSVIRLGGDEFALLLPNLSKEQLGQLWKRLCLAFQQQDISLGAGAIIINSSYMPDNDVWKKETALERIRTLEEIEEKLKIDTHDPLYRAKNECKDENNPNFRKCALHTPEDMGKK